MVKADKAVKCAELEVENDCFQDFDDRIVKSSDNLYSVSMTIISMQDFKQQLNVFVEVKWIKKV